MEDLVHQDQYNDLEPHQNKNVHQDYIFDPIKILAVEGGRIHRLNLPER